MARKKSVHVQYRRVFSLSICNLCLVKSKDGESIDTEHRDPAVNVIYVCVTVICTCEHVCMISV
jgi:hypothetical protein